MKTEPKKRGRMTLWRIAAALGLLVLLLLYVALPPVHRAISGWMMAYTQRSVQSVAGAMLQAGVLAPLKPVWLCAVQTFVLPWLIPYSIGGSVFAFGPAVGVLIALLGTLIGACAWFGIVRLFLGSRFKTPTEHPHALTAWEGFSLVAALNWLTLGMLSVAGALFGATRVRFGKFLLFAAATELPIVILYAVCCSPYRALLPNTIETAIRILGGLAALGFIVSRWVNAMCRPPAAKNSRNERERD